MAAQRSLLKRLALSAPLLVALLVSCGPAPASRGGESAGGAPAAPKTLRLGMQVSNEQASPALYGQVGSGSAALEHFFIFHSNLTIFDPQKNIVPRLAQKVPSIQDGDW